MAETQASTGHGAENPGRLFEDPRRLRGDLDLVRQSVHRRWPITDADKERAVEVLRTEINNQAATQRSKRASIRLLKELERQIQADEHAAGRILRPPDSTGASTAPPVIVITLDPQMPGAHRLPRRALPSTESLDASHAVRS